MVSPTWVSKECTEGTRSKGTVHAALRIRPSSHMSHHPQQTEAMGLATSTLAQGTRNSCWQPPSIHPLPPVQGILTIWRGVIVPVPGLHDEGKRTLPTRRRAGQVPGASPTCCYSGWGQGTWPWPVWLWDVRPSRELCSMALWYPPFPTRVPSSGPSPL